MKNILCYGDSNTWGYIPGSNLERFPRNIRWTGVLQGLLGDDYHIIEEGLNGRTTCFDDPSWPGRNGLSSFYVTLESCMPVDLIIWMLGTNDAKNFFPGQPHVCGSSIELYDHMMRGRGYGSGKGDPKVLIVSPIAIQEDIVRDTFNAGDAARFASKLAGIYKKWADQLGYAFFDASSVAQPDPADGLHMNPDSHAAFARAMEAEIKKIIG